MSRVAPGRQTRCGVLQRRRRPSGNLPGRIRRRRRPGSWRAWARERLLDRHPRLRVTLFVTPDWRLKRLVPTRKWLTRIPLLRERIHWAPLTPRGHFRIDRFPEFVAYLNALPRTDCALHGLHHAHPGPRMAVEFQEQSRSECSALLQEARRIFATAGLRHVQGFAPPAW